MIINGFEVEKYNVHGITEGADKWTCPECSHTRKKSTQKCMSVFWDTGLGRCNHCGAQVQLHTYKKKGGNAIKQYVRPREINRTDLSDSLVEYFKGRGISQTVLNRLKIAEGRDSMFVDDKWKDVPVMMFPYYREDTLINIKYRHKRSFKLSKDAERIPYNLNGIRTTKECIIVEGEVDVMSYCEIGRWDTVGLPNGAQLKGSNLEWLDNSIEYFENKERIYIGLDNDAAGINTQKEIVRRLGADKCKLIDMRGYKDPNEILMKEGTRGLELSIENAKEIPIENVSSIGDWESEYDNFLVNGMKGGYKTGLRYLDEIFSTYTGQFITLTGTPSCLTGDALVTMANGTQKRIDSVKAGDKIISINEHFKAVEDTVETQWEAGVKDVYKVKLKSGKEIQSTKEHVYMTFHGMRELNSIKTGDYIGTLVDAKLNGSLNWDEVVSIEYVGKEMTYDIEVKTNENFIANGISVKNSGKSELVDSMCIGYNLNYGWKVAYASPENKPNVIHASKIEAKLVGQWVNSKAQLETDWHKKAKEYIDGNFKFIDLERFTLESVLAKAKEMIRRYGIKVLVIDPYNKVRLHASLGKQVNDYTNDYLAMVDEFARTNDILIILVAHPRKPEVGNGKYIPIMYDIKGGGEFYDMSPHGLLAHRDFDNDATLFKVLKCKFSFLGENGAQCWYKWNKNNGRYSEFGIHSDKIEECSNVMYDDSNMFDPKEMMRNPLDSFHSSEYSADELPF